MRAPALMEHSSYCAKDRRRLSRFQIDYGHIAYVRFMRAVWLKRDGTLPTWKAGVGFKTVLP